MARGQRGPAADGEAELPAEFLVERAEDEPLRERVLRLQHGTDALPRGLAVGHLLPRRHGPREDLLLPAAGVGDRLDDGIVELLEHARDRDQNRRPDLGEVLRDGVDALGVRDRAAAGERGDVARRPLEGVREREEREVLVGGAEVEHLQRGPRVRADVGVREHDALRHTRRPARVDQRRNVVRPDGVGERVEVGAVRVGVGAAGGEGLGPARDRDGQRALRFFEHDDVLQLRQLVEDGGGFFELEIRRDDEHARAGIAEDVLDLVGGERRVERDVDGAEELGAEVGHGPLGPVLREHGHAVTGPHADVVEPAREREGVGVEVGVRDRRPARRLVFVAERRAVGAVEVGDEAGEELRDRLERDEGGHGRSGWEGFHNSPEWAMRSRAAGSRRCDQRHPLCLHVLAGAESHDIDPAREVVTVPGYRVLAGSVRPVGERRDTAAEHVEHVQPHVGRSRDVEGEGNGPARRVGGGRMRERLAVAFPLGSMDVAVKSVMRYARPELSTSRGAPRVYPFPSALRTPATATPKALSELRYGEEKERRYVPEPREEVDRPRGTLSPPTDHEPMTRSGTRLRRCRRVRYRSGRSGR